MNNNYRNGCSNRECYEYQRYRVLPVKTRSGRTTRRTRKYISEKLYANTPYRSSSKEYPVKQMTYVVGPGGEIHKFAKRKKVGRAGIKRYYNRYK